MFIAEEKHHDLVKDIPEGVIMRKGGSENESEGEATMTAVSNVRTTNNEASMSLPSDLPPTTVAGASTWSSGGGTEVASGNQMVNFSPLPGNYSNNMNPALNASMPSGGTGDVRIMNTLESQPTSSLENFAMADSVLEGIPGSMFDWGGFPSACPCFFTDLIAIQGNGTTSSHVLVPISPWFISSNSIININNSSTSNSNNSSTSTSTSHPTLPGHLPKTSPHKANTNMERDISLSSIMRADVYEILHFHFCSVFVLLLLI